MRLLYGDIRDITLQCSHLITDYKTCQNYVKSVMIPVKFSTNVPAPVMVAQIGRMTMTHRRCHITQHLQIYRKYCQYRNIANEELTHEKAVRDEDIQAEERVARPFKPRCQVTQTLDELRSSRRTIVARSA